jgi:hypothetical protein
MSASAGIHVHDTMEEKPSNKSAYGLDPSASDTSVTKQLEGMGYAPEMKRNLGLMSVLGLSFAIMAVPFGTSTTLNIALTDGGPVTILYGVSPGQT